MYSSKNPAKNALSIIIRYSIACLRSLVKRHVVMLKYQCNTANIFSRRLKAIDLKNSGKSVK